MQKPTKLYSSWDLSSSGDRPSSHMRSHELLAERHNCRVSKKYKVEVVWIAVTNTYDSNCGILIVEMSRNYPSLSRVNKGVHHLPMDLPPFCAVQGPAPPVSCVNKASSTRDVC